MSDGVERLDDILHLIEHGVDSDRDEVLSAADDDRERILKRADIALYTAKNQGRNRVVSRSPKAPPRAVA